MKHGSLKYWILSICTLALFSTASAEELIDLGKTNLRVTKVEHQDAVQCFSLKNGEHYLSPKPGYKGIVVTLEGRIPTLVLNPGAFFAVYDDLMNPGKVDVSQAYAMCLGAIFGEKAFFYAKEETYYQKVKYVGPFATRLLFYIPTAVTEFHVVYPALIRGVVMTDGKI